MQSKEKYNQNIIKLKESLGKTNLLALPKITKITLSIGFAKVRDKKDIVAKIKENIADIAGQRAIITKSKKSIAGFKVRDGEEIGLKVTLRGDRMWQFLDKLINTALPQIRDFNGFSRSCVDKQGNVAIGIREHIIFPEISYDDINITHGLSATITIKADNREEAIKYLELINFPFERD